MNPRKTPRRKAQPAPDTALSHVPDHADASAALLDAARRIFEAEGVKGLSVRRVAQDAHCTTMAVYSRFQGKHGILGALFDEGFDKLAMAQQAVKPSLKGAQRVLALCRAYRATAHAYPHHYALMLGHFSGELAPSESSQAKALSTLNYLADAVANMAAAQSKRRPAHMEVATRLFAFCHGWVSLERMQFLADDARTLKAFDRAVMALAADPC